MWENAGQSHKRPRPQSLHDHDSASNNNSEADAAIFASLKSVLGRCGGSGDAVSTLFKQHGLDSLVTDTVDVDIKNSNTTSEPMHVDFKVAKLLPFDYRAVGDATWQCIQRDQGPIDDRGDYCVVEKSDHLVAIKLVVTPKPSMPLLTLRSVFQRFSEADRVVFLYETHAESAAASTSSTKNGVFPAIRYHEQGWLTIAPIRVPSASVASITRQFTRITPAVTNASTATESHASGRGVLTDLLIALQLQSVHKTHETIQDMLIDAQVTTSTHLTSSASVTDTTTTTSSSQGQTRGVQSS